MSSAYGSQWLWRPEDRLEGAKSGFAAMLGLTPEDEAYIPFFDSNLDGLITESDAAAVGYYWAE